MKVANAEKHVLGHSGLAETKAFEIRASAHAFKILSSGLYSDKVTAVLREIGCNAYDAHVEAGCPQKPFIVKLPNSLDPQFYIRDHGPGLSHDGVMQLYTTYFASTKQDSNDYTGAFGLGSKSPFSYTDAFTITSCHGGRKRIYTAHIGDKGSPVVALMGEGDLDKGWDTGLEIGFPVRPGDFTEFANKAARVFRGFKTIPKILGGAAVKPIELEEDFGEYGFLKNEADIHVLMGNVMYPVDVEKLPVLQDAKSNVLLSAGRGMDGVLLRFDIGELQVAASREELQYDSATQKALQDRLVKAVSDVMSELKKKFASVKTWSDMCRAAQVKESVAKGLRLTSELLDAAGVNKNAVKIYSSHYYQLPANLPTTLAHFCIIERDGDRLRTNRPDSATGRSYVEYRDDITIVSGVEKQGYARVKKAIFDGALDGRVVLVSPRKPSGMQHHVDALASALEGVFPGVTHVGLSAFPPPPSTRVPRKKGQLPAFPTIMVKVDGSDVTITSVDPDRRVYVPAFSRSAWGRRTATKYIVKPDRILEQYEWTKLWRNLAEIKKEIDLEVKQPVVLRRGEAKRCHFDKRPDWMPFSSHVEKLLLDKGNLDALAELVDGHKPIVDLRGEGNPDGTLEALVTMKQFQPKLFEVVEPVLERHGIADEVEKIRKRSWRAKDKYYNSSAEPPVLTSYKGVADILDIKVDTPEFKAATLSLDGKFKSSDIDYATMVSVGKASKGALVNLLEDLII